MFNKNIIYVVIFLIGSVTGAYFSKFYHFDSGYRAGVKYMAQQIQLQKENDKIIKGQINEKYKNMSIYDICVDLGGLPDDCR